MGKFMLKNKEVDIVFPNDGNLVYKKCNGAFYLGDSKQILQSKAFQKIQGKVNLIVTSPPYPLNTKKRYGNKQGEEYLCWIKSLAPVLADMLSDDGSLIIELGNSWEPKRPVQSLLPLKALIALTESSDTGLRLIQQFVCYNPSRLPSPAQWVTVNPMRVVDSYTHVWWLSKTDMPKADNRKILRPYSKSMRQLLKRGKYNSGRRPSEHTISTQGFLKDRGGSIPHNLFELEAIDPSREVRLPNAFSFSNTSSNDYFHKTCKSKGLTPHPARMPIGLASFFIDFLTDKNDLVLDPFGGSNTTGFAAALAGRRWISIDMNEEYIDQSKLRFDDPILKAKRV